MKTLEIEVSNDLFQRLQPYKDRLAHWLDMSLSMLTKSSNGKDKEVRQSVQKPVRKQVAEPIINLEAYKKTEKYRKQKELIEFLDAELGLKGPNIDTMLEYVTHPDQRNWQPIHAEGKPPSELIIEQRRGVFSE